MVKEKEQVFKDDEDDEEASNVLPFGPVTRSDLGGGGGNWLKGLSVGTVFVVQPINDKGFQGTEFKIITKANTVALLQLENNEGSFIMWVIQTAFCRNFNLLEIIRVP